MTDFSISDAAASSPPDTIHARLDGPVVIVGYGSIGRGVLPLIRRHIAHDPARLVVVDCDDSNRAILDEQGIRFVHQAITGDNMRDVLTPLLKNGQGRGFCVNVSVDISSIEMIHLCEQLDVFYIDSSIEPWRGYFTDDSIDVALRTNYAMREMMLAERSRRNGSGVTAATSCGANPGMVSWLLKKGLLNLARDLGLDFDVPQTRLEWAQLMRDAGVKGIHIAERDTQRARRPKKMGSFVNTWSIEGMTAEGLSAAELGWGTHEKWMPVNARRHESGCQAGIYMLQPGGDTRVRSWCPTPGPQRAFLVPHHESIAIADYYTIGEGATPAYRPTCHYAYRPSNQALLSMEEMFERGGRVQKHHKILGEEDILDGMDELGVLLYGHDKNAYWFGSQLTIEETRELAPNQNATGLQVTSGVLAGMVWAIENPDAGVVESDDMDFERCLEVQMPYLGKVAGFYTDWNPLKNRHSMFPENIDTEDPWQFRNVLVRHPG
ncbi:MAG TPA: saccharopine dehydrogenase C-terminal domain-containing protein [Alphaproteobacteria bacterium]|nr:saccharopine dehydrogenase C-terminal domain-containing protein [Alphaproteobacteria bacterium]